MQAYATGPLNFDFPQNGVGEMLGPMLQEVGIANGNLPANSSWLLPNGGVIIGRGEGSSGVITVDIPPLTSVPEAPVELTWECKDGLWMLTVLDGGSGFAPDALLHLFDPTFTTKPTGSGLGLAIVQRIVADHGGTIAAGNRAEGGAWVRIGLRLAA